MLLEELQFSYADCQIIEELAQPSPGGRLKVITCMNHKFLIAYSPMYTVFTT